MSFFESNVYYATAFYFISAYTSAFEIGGHTILSINRYYAIKNIEIHHTCWSKKMKQVFYILLFVSPIPTTFYRVFTPATYNYIEEVPVISYVDPTVSKVLLLFITVTILFSDS